ncbi:PrsW family intramembrane metalloprotease [Agromyces sp. SYSU T00194]|uniref:PrsW family intramembrane metalloprotease n=1 Tax=Agromyces chitinivorans TaxID=3158560 RepID=UPI00339B5A34
MSGHAPNGPVGPQPHLRPTSPRTSRSRGAGLAAVGIVLASLVGLAVAAYFVQALGTGAAAAGAVLALVPLAAVLWAVRWIDRWEPEPRGALWFAFLWGATVSVALALLVDLALVVLGGIDDEFLGAVVQAPIVEELAKAAGLLVLAAVARAHLDGPVDGLVYAATIAAGFAFTENALYFGVALLESGPDGLGSVFFVRGVMSPFAHVMFTACTGIAIGTFVARGRSALLGALVGLVPAIGLHALWNGALFVVDDFFGYYLLVQVPLFVLAIGITVWLRRLERRVLRRRLAEYAAVGWFSAGELEMFTTPEGRRRARANASARGAVARRTMDALIRDTTHLAFTRERIASGRAAFGGRDGGRAAADEQALLASIVAARASLLA